MCTEIINKYFKLFNLDNRASKRELELAYDVLTKDKSISDVKLGLYRNAYEYLMTNVFHEEGVQIKEIHKPVEPPSEALRDLMAFDASLLDEIPEPIQEGLEDIEENINEDLSDVVKMTLATQKINPAMFFHSIQEHIHKIFNFWFVDDIKALIKGACLNPLDYKTMYFEIHGSFGLILTEQCIRQFVKNLKKSNNNKLLTPKFEVHNIEGGCMGMIITESDNAIQLGEFMKLMAKNLDCKLAITIKM